MKQTKIERILCPVDFSAFSVRAYDYASSLAQHCGAKLFVQHVVELWQYPSATFAATAYDYDKFCENLLKQGQEQLHSFVKTHTKNGIDPECVTSEGMAADCILSFADLQAINLIVIGTHGIRGFERLMMGSVTEKVLRTAHCPVLAVNNPSHDSVVSATSQHPVELRQIIFCTDFSDNSNGALEYAISVADEYKANLTLVHVLEGVSKSHSAKDTAKANDQLDSLIPPQARLTSRITTTVRVGRAYSEISQLARESSADLVIMTVHGRNALDDTVFGSTTYRVLQLGSCPVLAVHPLKSS
jgi:nucleotide-binding universal stress UspA family protein